MLKLIPIFLLLFACTKKDEANREPLSLSGATMGTTFSVKYFSDDDGIDEEELLTKINSTLLAVNREMSTYMSDSEISRFNGLTTTDSWFTASQGFYWVTKTALALAEKTDGIYDPTIGPLVDLWGFGPNKAQKVPSADEVAKAKARVGFRKVIVHDTEAQLRKTQGDVTLDLSSIAKGWGVDVVGRLLEEFGIKNYMVEIGGEVRTFGGKPDGSPWQIGVTIPESENVTGAQKILQLNTAALATSGNYRNFFEKDGKRYAHILDARTGAPAMSDIASVTVISEDADCTQADALATALLAMGTAAAQEFAQNNQLIVYIISHGNDGEFTEWMTPQFAKYVKN